MPYLSGFYHLVWTTKDRVPSIDSERETILARSLRATCDVNRWTLHAFGIMPDHIHVVMLFSTKFALADVIRILKVNSSHLLTKSTNDGTRPEFKWQTEYGAFLFHNDLFGNVVNYVRRQPEHHSANNLWVELERTDRLQ
jgi:putative transposase